MLRSSEPSVIVTMLFGGTILINGKPYEVTNKHWYRISAACRRLWERGMADSSLHQGGISYRVYLARSAA